MAGAGVLLDSSPLQPPHSATTVRVRNGETQLSDGPFAEIKEQLGGYYILDCDDLDSAVQWVATIPSAKYGSIEVRPLMVMGSHGPSSPAMSMWSQEVATQPSTRPMPRTRRSRSTKSTERIPSVSCPG
jgi:hypothetical protein